MRLEIPIRDTVHSKILLFAGFAMRRILLSLVTLIILAPIAQAQVNTSAADSVLRAYAMRNRTATANANQADRDLLQRQPELFNAQTQALQMGTYTRQEIQDAVTLLLQRHPDSVEFLKSIDGKTPLLMPMKDLSAYDYMLALYALSREKRAEAEIEKKNAEEASKAVQQLQDNHPDFAQCAPTIVKLLPVFPQRTGESVSVYFERLYRMAKEE